MRAILELMVGVSRGAMIAALSSVLVMAALFAACGLDESGIIPGDASVGPDVINGDVLLLPDILVDNYVAPPCSEPDASLDASCLGVPVPDGWFPIGFKVGAAAVTCPGDSGDFVAKQYVKDPTLDNNSCACGGTCGPSGSWSCKGSLYAGGVCTGYIDAGSGAFCATTSHSTYSATLQRSGSPSCSGAAQQTGTLDASAIPIGACVPQKCESDFCGLAAQQFTLCIFNTTVTDGGCPQDFPNSTVAGVQAYAACTPCSCDLTNPGAGCTGTVTAFSTSNCDGGFQATASANGGCNTTLGYNSLLLQPDTPPTPQCDLSKPSGVPLLAGALTICCP